MRWAVVVKRTGFLFSLISRSFRGEYIRHSTQISLCFLRLARLVGRKRGETGQEPADARDWFGWLDFNRAVAFLSY